jgi:hypothetical protein
VVLNNERRANCILSSQVPRNVTKKLLEEK